VQGLQVEDRQDELRISGVSGQYGPLWRHVECQDKRPKDLETVHGFEKLGDADQATLKAWFGQAPPPKRKATDAAAEAKQLHPKKMKLADLKAVLESSDVETEPGVDKASLVSLVGEVKTRAALEAKYLTYTNAELQSLLRLNLQHRNGDKATMVALCIDGKLHGQLGSCPGPDGVGCEHHSRLAFYALPGKKVGHGGVGRYQCLGNYGTRTGYIRCPFVVTGPSPVDRTPWQDASPTQLAAQTD
jgi:hypothetical protein